MLRRFLPPLLSLFLWIVLAVFSLSAAQAATLTVTNLNDNGPGSLRQAVTDANANPGDDTIQFQSGLSGTILLGSGAITISKSSDTSLTINGPGANVLAISGNHLSQIFIIGHGTIVLNGLTLKEGKSSDSGGAIYGIYADGALTVNNSTLSGNSASYGGGIYLNSTLMVSNSTLSGNSATYFGGGINNNLGTVTVSNSTLSGNSASYGGGIHNYQGTLTISNATLSGNTATTYGGGIYNNGQSLTVGNSLVAGNTAPNGKEIYGDSAETFASLGHNLFGENGISGLEGYAMLTSRDFILPGAISTAISPLANNGGPTQTLLPVVGSLVIDHGDNTLIPAGVTTDQRGPGFPRIIGDTVDIGAVEGTAISDSATTLITHYYTSILEREPEPDGLAFWLALIADTEARGEDVKSVFRQMANFFFNSPEYIGRNTTDRQFITNLYLTFFQRQPDDSGYTFWLGQLANGMSRNDAMQGFLYSQEFTDFMASLGF